MTLDRKRFSLNRIACPKLPLDRFFAFAKSLELTRVELRNDLGSPSVTDSLTPAQVATLASGAGVEVVTINALQKFNLQAVRAKALAELGQLVEVARQIGCKGIVLCPNNDTADRRPAEQMFAETVSALKDMRPIFEKAGMTGLVEPLGFVECSLRSARTAMKAIDESGAGCYRIVHDTFHHFLGTDSRDLLQDRAYAKRVGLIHVSGVEAGIPKEQYRDPQRILVGEKDTLDSRAQILALIAAGYEGPISFEPFAAEVQALDEKALGSALRESLKYLAG